MHDINNILCMTKALNIKVIFDLKLREHYLRHYEGWIETNQIANR